MRIAIAWLAALASAGALHAADAAVRQSGRANVFGLVQVGPRSPPVDVQQEGANNILGVIQVAPNARLTARQSGDNNTAVVGQFAPPAGFPLRGAMP